jgi:hypothetical protein
VKWLADECFDNDIIRGLLRRSPGLDLVRAQDLAEVAGSDDGHLLAWANREGSRPPHARSGNHGSALLLQHQRESGCTPVVLVPDSLPIGAVIEEILLLFSTSVRKR